MIVMKFGGTSVGTADSIRRVVELVRARLDQQPVLVVSAHSGVTNALVALAERAPAGEADTSALEARHRELATELGVGTEHLEPLLAELRDLARGMALVGEASPRATDHMLSFGERLSARTVAAVLTAAGTPARAVDAFEAGLRTDSNYGRARPKPDDGRIARFFAGLQEVPVVTGFLAQDAAGHITTLGRNGSDYSAALFGQALAASEIQIWTDVDGVMSADPRVVPAARPIARMSFDEASELAYYGSKVLHPATIQPAMLGGIPVRVLNTHRPDSPGTTILAEYEEAGVSVRAVVHKRGIRLINLVTPRMLQAHGFLARVFAAAAAHEVDVDLVATSEVSITMTTDRADGVEGLAGALAELGEVSVEPDHAMVCVVGRGMKDQPGVAASVLATLGDAGVRVRVISQGAIKVNLALILAEADMERAVQALHERFFPAGA